MSKPDNAIDYARAHRDEHLDELREFVTIPSISAVPAHAEDIRRAAVWLSNWIATEECRELAGSNACAAQSRFRAGPPHTGRQRRIR